MTLYKIPDGRTASLCQCPLSGELLSTSKAGFLPYTDPRPNSVQKFFITCYCALHVFISSHPNNPLRWVLLSLCYRWENLNSRTLSHLLKITQLVTELRGPITSWHWRLTFLQDTTVPLKMPFWELERMDRTVRPIRPSIPTSPAPADLLSTQKHQPWQELKIQ